MTILAIISWWFTPVGSWLPRERISHFVESEGVPAETFQEGQREPDEPLQGPGEHENAPASAATYSDK